MVNGAEKLRQLTGRELNNSQIINLKNAALAEKKVVDMAKIAADKVTNTNVANKNAIALNELNFKKGKVSSKSIVKNGRRLLRHLDAQGKVTSTEDLGPAESKFKPNIFQLPDGNLKEVKVGDPIPPGAILAPTRNLDLTASGRVKLNKDLAGLKTAFTTLTDSAGNHIDPNSMLGWVDYYNRYSVNDKVVPVKAVPGSLFPLSFGTSASFKIVPKTPEEIQAATTVTGTTPPPPLFQGLSELNGFKASDYKGRTGTIKFKSDGVNWVEVK